VQEKIERAEIRQLKALDCAFADALEVSLDTLRCHLAPKQRIILIFERNETDIGRVPLIA
jgi:hypothetical protein